MTGVSFLLDEPVLAPGSSILQAKSASWWMMPDIDSFAWPLANFVD